MQKNYNENLVAGAAIRDDKGRRISKLFEASHPKMTVGYAKNLIMPDTPTEQEFNFRQSGGGVIEDGVAVIDKVKGNSVVWNQLIKNGNFASIEEWVEYGATISISNGEATITQTITGDAGVGQKVNVIAGHKIMILIDVKEVTSMYVGVFRSQYDSIGFQAATNAKLINSVGFDSFFTTIAELGNYKFYVFGFARGGVDSFIKVSSVNLIDLTQMFGAGNEPTTYEEFLSRKPKVADEYAYNEGTIVNNKVEKVVTTGRNLCPYLEQGTLNIYNGSEEPSTTRIRTPFIPISNKYSYCTMLNKWSIRNGCFYDRNKNFISSGYPSTSNGVLDSSAIPANAAFCRLIYSGQNGTDVVTPSYDVFMFAVGNTTIPTTKYEPYEKHELDLSWVKDIKDAEGVKLFEDGMRSAGTAFDEAAKGRAIKRIGVKVFDGNVAIASGEISGDAYRVMFQAAITTSSNGVHNMLASNDDGVYAQYNGGYYYDKYAIGFASVADVWFCLPSSVAQTISQVRAYLDEHPITFIYELAEPIEVEYDEKNLTYPVVAGGTEEAIASEPSTAFRADIGYGIDAVKTILDLKARVEALEGK